ncbi:MAG: hypothetical protein OHK0024_06740 [Thalassobaculales bacterium]
MSRPTAVLISTSAEAGYSDLYTPGGPGRTPTAGTIYTEPSAAQRFGITVSLEGPGSVPCADPALDRAGAA